LEVFVFCGGPLLFWKILHVEADGDPTFIGELQSIADHVHQNLLDSLRVSKHLVWDIIAHNL
jgi:hypothetical protein